MKSRLRTPGIGALAAAALGLLAGPAAAEPGVTADKIVFRQSAAFEGPAAALGTGMRAGRLAVAALEQIAGAPTRQALLDAVRRTGTLDFGGVKLTFGPDDTQGMDQVFLTQITADGAFKAVDRLSESGS
ncbi:hypothetical protein [Rhodovibrio sodomensis]|nr:hypothetical protein [Rhodovibrio sodomensis]